MKIIWSWFLNGKSYFVIMQPNGITTKHKKIQNHNKTLWKLMKTFWSKMQLLLVIFVLLEAINMKFQLSIKKR